MELGSVHGGSILPMLTFGGSFRRTSNRGGSQLVCRFLVGGNIARELQRGVRCLISSNSAILYRRRSAI